MYIGKVASVPGKEGFGFISLNTVTKENGSPHGLDTKTDIFIHQDDCQPRMEVGLTLKFEVTHDRHRGAGNFRAQGATEYILQAELLPATGDVFPGLDLAVRRAQILYHVAMKEVPAAEVALARTNAPLDSLPRDEASIHLPNDEVGMHRALGAYLASQFPQMVGIGLTYEVIGYDKNRQDKLVADEVKGLSDLGMAAQAQTLKEIYARFQAVRRLLTLTIQQGLLRPGTQLAPSVLQAMFHVVEQAESSTQKQAQVLGAEQTLGFMIEKGLLRPNTVIPNELIVELFCACPVWYWSLKQNETNETLANAKLETSKDPKVHRVTKRVCDMVPNQRWADTFQMFNRRTRTLVNYQGEVIPTHIRSLLQPASQVFDDIAIITPYHDVAGADWQNLAWLRSIDPYVIGFKWGLPVFFVLGRYSDSGIFPLLEELVADTIQFLRQNKDKLAGFNHTQSPYWYYKDVGNNQMVGSLPHSKAGDYLIKHTSQLIASFDAGHLFDWLRGT